MGVVLAFKSVLINLMRFMMPRFLANFTKMSTKKFGTFFTTLANFEVEHLVVPAYDCTSMLWKELRQSRL